MKDEGINIFKDKFKDSDTISINDIRIFLKEKGENISDSSLWQAIFYLKRKGVIQNVKRGYYTINIKNEFQPEDDFFINKVRRLFTTKYPEIRYCIWSTFWLNQFMIHQPFKWFYIFETEKDMLESAFNLFQNNNISAYLEPDYEIMTKYVVENNKSVIIKNLTARSPLIDIHNNKFPALEKILVDAFCDKDILYFYQGKELENIFSNSIKYNKINYSLLLRYADRRNKKDILKDFLIKNINVDKKLLS